MDALACVVIDVGRYAAMKGWGRPPQLYALTRKKTIRSPAPTVAAAVQGKRDDALIPIEQDPLPPGDPDTVLAAIGWTEEVEGCVLVTELLVLPPGAEEEALTEPAAAEERAASLPGRKKARLAVGVLRDGSYACCLQLENEKELTVSPGLAPVLVAALFATLVPGNTAAPDVLAGPG
jgi:hypothetical protein